MRKHWAELTKFYVLFLKIKASKPDTPKVNKTISWIESEITKLIVDEIKDLIKFQVTIYENVVSEDLSTKRIKIQETVLTQYINDITETLSNNPEHAEKLAKLFRLKVEKQLANTESAQTSSAQIPFEQMEKIVRNHIPKSIGNGWHGERSSAGFFGSLRIFCCRKSEPQESENQAFQGYYNQLATRMLEQKISEAEQPAPSPSRRPC